MQHLYLITGASRGLGHAMARQLLAAGHTVVGLSRSVDGALAAAADKAGAALLQWPVDLSEPISAAARLEAWLDAQEAAAFSSATLINNAGTVGHPGPLALLESADLARSLRIGLEAPLLLAAAFLRATRHWPGERRLLNISSGLGRHAIPGQAPYCAAKAGMDHFSRAVALEQALLPHGAKVVALAPGVIDTDMQSELRATGAERLPDTARYARLKAEGRLDSPAHAAAKVLAFLARADFGRQPVADVNDPVG